MDEDATEIEVDAPSTTPFRRNRRGKRGKKDQPKFPPPAPQPVFSFAQHLANVKRQAPFAPTRFVSFQDKPTEVEEEEEEDGSTLLRNLSSKMDVLYPTSIVPVKEPDDVPVDPVAFLELGHTLYQQCIAAESDAAEELSEPEFLLVTSQLLAAHTLDAAAAVDPENNAFAVLPPDVLPKDAPLLAPLMYYLEGLGIVGDDQGKTLYPSLILPRADVVKSGYGLMPSLLSDHYEKRTSPGYTHSMLPLGLLRSLVEDLHRGEFTQPPDSPDHVLRFKMMDPAPTRQGKLTLPWDHTQPGLVNATLQYNPQLYDHYLRFVWKFNAHMFIGKRGDVTFASAAFLAFVDPKIESDSLPYDAYEVFSPVKLTTAEQQAARAFRYRVSSKNDYFQEKCKPTPLPVIGIGPRLATRRRFAITGVPSYRALVHTLVDNCF